MTSDFRVFTGMSFSLQKVFSLCQHFNMSEFWKCHIVQRFLSGRPSPPRPFRAALKIQGGGGSNGARNRRKVHPASLHWNDSFRQVSRGCHPRKRQERKNWRVVDLIAVVNQLVFVTKCTNGVMLGPLLWSYKWITGLRC